MQANVVAALAQLCQLPSTLEATAFVAGLPLAPDTEDLMARAGYQWLYYQQQQRAMQNSTSTAVATPSTSAAWPAGASLQAGAAAFNQQQQRPPTSVGSTSKPSEPPVAKTRKLDGGGRVEASAAPAAGSASVGAAGPSTGSEHSAAPVHVMPASSSLGGRAGSSSATASNAVATAEPIQHVDSFAVLLSAICTTAKDTITSLQLPPELLAALKLSSKKAENSAPEAASGGAGSGAATAGQERYGTRGTNRASSGAAGRYGADFEVDSKGARPTAAGLAAGADGTAPSWAGAASAWAASALPSATADAAAMPGSSAAPTFGREPLTSMRYYGDVISSAGGEAARRMPQALISSFWHPSARASDAWLVPIQVRVTAMKQWSASAPITDQQLSLLQYPAASTMPGISTGTIPPSDGQLSSSAPAFQSIPDPFATAALPDSSPQLQQVQNPFSAALNSGAGLSDPNSVHGTGVAGPGNAFSGVDEMDGQDGGMDIYSGSASSSSAGINAMERDNNTVLLLDDCLLYDLSEVDITPLQLASQICEDVVIPLEALHPNATRLQTTTARSKLVPAVANSIAGQLAAAAAEISVASASVIAEAILTELIRKLPAAVHACVQRLQAGSSGSSTPAARTSPSAAEGSGSGNGSDAAGGQHSIVLPVQLLHLLEHGAGAVAQQQPNDPSSSSHGHPLSSTPGAALGPTAVSITPAMLLHLTRAELEAREAAQKLLAGIAATVPGEVPRGSAASASASTAAANGAVPLEPATINAPASSTARAPLGQLSLAADSFLAYSTKPKPAAATLYHRYSRFPWSSPVPPARILKAWIDAPVLDLSLCDPSMWTKRKNVAQLLQHIAAASTVVSGAASSSSADVHVTLDGQTLSLPRQSKHWAYLSVDVRAQGHRLSGIVQIDLRGYVSCCLAETALGAVSGNGDGMQRSEATSDATGRIGAFLLDTITSSLPASDRSTVPAPALEAAAFALQFQLCELASVMAACNYRALEALMTAPVSAVSIGLLVTERPTPGAPAGARGSDGRIQTGVEYLSIPHAFMQRATVHLDLAEVAVAAAVSSQLGATRLQSLNRAGIPSGPTPAMMSLPANAPAPYTLVQTGRKRGRPPKSANAASNGTGGRAIGPDVLIG